MKIQINNKEVETLPGETLLETARREGYNIPSLCYAKEAKHKSSCMVCAVRNVVTGQIFPSCTTLPVESMQIDTESPEVIHTRTLSLELLLSDHRADCEAPCKTACPGNMDVAAMNRLYDQNRTDEALTLLRDTLVIPATLCYICNAPCEKICRKGDVNTSVSIREIKKKLVAATDLNKILPPVPNGKKAAVNGSGPASLSTAYHLCQQGYAVTIYEQFESILSPYIPADQVPPEILRLEIEVLIRMGIQFKHTPEAPSPTGYDTIITPQPKTKQPARLVLEGHRLAVQQPPVPFNSTYNRFTEAEKAHIRQSYNSSRCLYCDCDAKAGCRLRLHATEYGIKTTRYPKSSASEALHRQEIGRGMYFEPAKCIKCGLCVYNSANGFTFKDRGFIMQVVLPEENAENINEQLIALCPTGALNQR
ncbi:NADPH-Fe(3+) oxidoreductase subunit beta [termite gut metagenome]|uniref:NADPH-Fe(3+) oxidoreductase subunit beta n=1 Tax=termite gut metagenome TaxID=433724 RepID=A0A5J4S0M8_9ZZZZ